ncbi:putative dehydrogenase [Microbacterium halimionae]|uniref:Putative dehydrogenase n=1 Tax=Microbacterium halimionae TaxID=1526413 RepID=A0A7W3PMN2_9MICO|nr:Gfo/Idh/MocA family oxidoreductase [Microbacterium halimionae]MBA8817241.1 putative dehydrogenase [Microbacterium halimionae]NII94691.1 putative dehydrogenase [Microbacterium halimionae]
MSRVQGLNRVLRCALVGTGAVAALHARAVEADPRAKLVAVSDHSREKAEEFARTWRVNEVYDSLEELLAAEHPDVVLVCTPPAAHTSQVIAALDAGADVVVEKPPAPSLDELEQMRIAERESGHRLAVVFQQRTGTAAAHVRSLLRSGALGRPLLAICQTLWFRGPEYYAVPWRGKWNTEGGGTTLGHGIHQIDLLAHLLGDWESVHGRLWRVDRDIETEDASTGTVVFADGVVATIVTSAVSPREVSALRIDTQKATITVEHLYGHGHENWSITPAPGVDAEEAASWRFPDTEERSDHLPLLRDVFTSFLSGEPLPPTAEAPARSLEIVAALYASAAGGGAIVTPASLAAHATHRRNFESPVTDMRASGL